MVSSYTVCMELIKEDVKLRRLKLEDQTAATALANNKNASKNLRALMPSPYTLQDIFEYNEASMRVLEKCGYKFEGIFEKNVYKDGAFYNEHRYSKIK